MIVYQYFRVVEVVHFVFEERIKTEGGGKKSNGHFAQQR